MKNQKISFIYVLVAFAAVLFTWFIHEFAHWLAYTLQGYDAFMGLNKAGVRGDEVPNIDQQVLGAAAGPIITVLQAILAYGFLKKNDWNKYVYLILFIPFYMRFLAGLMNVIQPNDEGFIGQQLGIRMFTISIIISAFLFWLVFKTSKSYQLKARFHVFTTLLIMFFSSVVIMVDQMFRIVLIS